ncbi:MAG TPA: sensor histidine kinase [Terriglobia bacterium]|nr:sensor histidine kinase [Terriglobia bacterium]
MAFLLTSLIKQPRPLALRYLASALSILAAFALTRSAGSLFATTAYALFLAAVMFSSWYGGLTPGLIVILLSVLALDRYFAPPALSGVLSPDDGVHLGIFLVAAGVINHLNRARMRAEEALRKSHEQLQTRIAERTADLQYANDVLGRLSGQLLHFQDEERRRMARLLHETVAQSLAALKMDLAVVRRLRKSNPARADEALEDAVLLAEDSVRELRTVSYLLHPPLLDEVGLASALRWYGAGFEKRSGIRTELNLPEDLGRLSHEVETTVFRIIQECLTNIHRHSGSPTAHIAMRKTSLELVVEVSDHGHGIPAPALAKAGASGSFFGVGIMGMRERVKQLGGQMQIDSSDHGTTVQVRLPCEGVTV